MNLRNLKIGTRLGLAFTIVLALTVSMTIAGVSQLQALSQATNDMEESVNKERDATEWADVLQANSVRAYSLAKTTSRDEATRFKEEMISIGARVSVIQKTLNERVKSEEGKKILEAVNARRAVYTSLRNKLFELKAAMAPGDEASMAKFANEELKPGMDGYEKSVRDLANHQKVMFDNSKKAADAVYASGRTLLIALGVAALLCGALLAWLLSRSITRPLIYAVTAAQAVAAGDLSTLIQVDSKDETGQLLEALRGMNAQLLAIVGRIKNGTETIATASSEIAVGNLDLSSRTEQQASSLEETASSMEELTSTVKQNAANARQANGLANQASDVARKGGEVVSQVVGTMTAINASSRKIVDIISVIDGIAFQTNILALNAAVEAARAGEQGRGFAVVATEVRSLAQRSAAAAKEIKTLIGDSVEKVESGSKLVGEAGTTMNEIVDSIKRVTDIMGEITAASQEQTAGIEQINQAITEMDNVTQQNAALVEEAAAAAESLQDQAANLSEVVAVFKTSTAGPPAVLAAESFQRAPKSLSLKTRQPAPQRVMAMQSMSQPASKQGMAPPKSLPSARPSKDSGDWEEF